MKKTIIIWEIFPYLVILLFLFLLVGAFHYPLISRITDFPVTMSGTYFDAEGFALTIGRLDVPCETLQYEAIHIDGKCYGYFGLTPSFFRIMLNGLCASCSGQWSRTMMVAAGLLIYASLVLLARRALAENSDVRLNPLWSHGFAMAMAFGSSLPFIISDPYGYHEAIIWAGAFTLLGFWATARYTDSGENWALRLSLIANFLALHSRFTVGIALTGATCLWLAAPLCRYLPQRIAALAPFSPEAMARPVRSGLLACLILCGMALTPPAVQYMKFGALMPSAASQPFYAKYPERVEKLKDGRFLTKNFPCDASLYFSPSMIGFQSGFPWLVPAYREFWFAGNPMPAKVAPYCRDSNVESFDPVFSIPYGLPVPLVLFLLGAIVALARRRLLFQWLPALLGGMVACIPLLFMSSVTYRYTFDFMPLFAVGSVIGWERIATMAAAGRALALVGVFALTFGALAINFSASLYSGSPQPYMANIAVAIERMIVGGRDKSADLR